MNNSVIQMASENVGLGTLMGVMTVLFLLFFLAWTVWTYAPANRARLEEDARIPFLDGDES